MSADCSPARRAVALRALGAAPGDVDALLAYGSSPLLGDPLPALPLPDEPCAATWAAWAAEAHAAGDGAACLQRQLVQLRFPVAAGVSVTPAYQAATRRGALDEAPSPAGWPVFADPAGVRVLVHATVVGPLPVVVARARADFELLLRALVHRSEPVPVPAAKGACMVAGFNNWARVAEERRRWAAARGADDDAAWRLAFAALVPHKARYQDRFVLLSEGAYSAVSAAELGVDADEWGARSLRIRLEHECAHYATKRLFGTMRNALHDELLADYLGITAPPAGAPARLPYSALWARRFLGVDEEGRVRPGGRLHNYRGDPPLADGAFAVVGRMAARATGALAGFDASRDRAGDACRDGLEVLIALARTPVEAMAGPDGGARLLVAHRAARAELRAATRAGGAAALQPGTSIPQEAARLPRPSAAAMPAAPSFTPNSAGAQP